LDYKRKLTSSEAERHFIYVDKSHRGMFPPPGKQFTLEVGKEKVKVKIDSKGRIWAALFWDCLPSFKKEDMIVISKISDRLFKIELEK
jgi:hypothetical protein